MVTYADTVMPKVKEVSGKVASAICTPKVKEVTGTVQSKCKEACEKVEAVVCTPKVKEVTGTAAQKVKEVGDQASATYKDIVVPKLKDAKDKASVTCTDTVMPKLKEVSSKICQPDEVWLQYLPAKYAPVKDVEAASVNNAKCSVDEAPAPIKKDTTDEVAADDTVRGA
jgi:hypothetical protein